MTRITALVTIFLALLALTLVGAPLVQHNVDALQVKRVHGERLAAWERNPSPTLPASREGAAGDPCALLPWLADFAQLAPRPTNCPPTEMTDLWTARQSWLSDDVDDACTRWQRHGNWVEPWRILDQSIRAAAWDDVIALLTCLEAWDVATLDDWGYQQFAGRAASAYRSLGDHLSHSDIEAAVNAYAAADRWDPNQRYQGTSAAARLWSARGEVDAALGLLQKHAEDANVAVDVRYRLWMESAALLSATPGRQETAQAAYDAARRLRPDQIAPYTGLSALYRADNPAWSIAALRAGLESPAAATASNRRALWRQLGDLHRSLAEWEAAACAYRAALAQPVPADTERGALQQLIDEMETRLGRSALCG